MAKLSEWIRRDTTGNKPAAAATNEGMLYFDTTLIKLQRSNGTSWEDCEATGATGLVSDTAYDATTWDGVTTISPSKNVVRDAIESLSHVVSGSLTAGNANAYAFNWQNPNAYKILIKRVMIYLTTAGGTATSVLDVGKAASTATHDDTLIDGLDLNTTGVFDNLNDAGTNGKSRQIVDENGGTNDWVTGQILVANAASLVGKYVIEYIGV